MKYKPNNDSQISLVWASSCSWVSLNMLCASTVINAHFCDDQGGQIKETTYYSIGLFFVVLAIISIGNNSIILNKRIDELWEHGDIAKKKSYRARNTSNKMMHTGQTSQIYLDEKIKVNGIITLQTVHCKHPRTNFWCIGWLLLTILVLSLFAYF